MEERRIVTVLFADIEGFTALAEHRDPESVKELLDACFGRLVPVIAEHGGHVDKIIGDEVMAVFGAPIAHEDDPERAVRAALALEGELQVAAPDLRLRVGVNTGEVLAGTVGPSSGYTVTGDVVNTAHRLVTAAGPGEVLVGERTRQATADVIVYELRGDLDLKGKSEAVRSSVAVAVRPERIGRMLLDRPLVGRHAELAILVDRVRVALTRPRAEMITVVGEPGVGKTRLATELVKAVPADVDPRVLWVSCPPYGPAAELAPLADLVRDALGVPGSMERGEQDRLLSSRVDDLGTDSPQLLKARLSALLGLGPVTSRSVDIETGPIRAGVSDQQLAAVRVVIGRLAATRPVLLVVDDLHWASPRLMRFLGQLPEHLVDRPLAVVGIGRDDLLERHGGALGPTDLRSIHVLDPLTAPASAELVAALLRKHTHGAHEPRMGPVGLKRLVETSAGSPLLIEQLVQYLVEAEILVEEEGRWHWTSDSEGNEANLPDGVRSLIGARLDALPATERAVLADAAVFGRTFWHDAVVELSDEAGADEMLQQLVSRGFVEEVAGEQGDRAFRHILTRDVAYAALPLAGRATRHARAARWLERRFDQQERRSGVGQVAHHYERAVMLGRAVDHTDPGLARHAFVALVEAARDEYRHEGLRRADHWYRRARDLGSSDLDATLDALAEHGQVLLELRQLEGAQDAFATLARQAGSHRPPLAALALAHLGAVARLQGDLEEAGELFDQALVSWRDLGDLQGLADTFRLQGWAEFAVGRPRAALSRLQRAAALEEQIDEPIRRGETLRYLGWCEFLAGEIGAAQRHLWEAMRCSADSEDFGSIGWSFGLLGHTFLQSGQASQAKDLASNLRAAASSESDPWGEWTCAILEAAAMVALGDAQEGLVLSEEVERRLEELEEPWGLALARVVRAQAARATGDLLGARSVLMSAVAASRQASHAVEDARLLAELARVELELGDLRGAERQARGALTLVRAGVGDHESGLRSLLVLAEVERARGHDEAAVRLLEEAASFREPEDRSETWRLAALALAELNLDRGGGVPAARALVELTVDPPADSIAVVTALKRVQGRLGSDAVSIG